MFFFFFSSRRRHTRLQGDWSSDVCSSDLFPGIICMSVIFTSVFFGSYIIWDRKFDFLKSVMVAPVSRTTIFLGKAFGGKIGRASCRERVWRWGVGVGRRRRRK